MQEMEERQYGSHSLLPKGNRNSVSPSTDGGCHASVTSYDLMRRESQEAWSGIEPNFTKRLTVDNTDITLDFRPMLSTTGEELDASHLEYMLPWLVEAVVRQCSHLTRLSVKIGTTRF